MISLTPAAVLKFKIVRVLIAGDFCHIEFDGAWRLIRVQRPFETFLYVPDDR